MSKGSTLGKSPSVEFFFNDWAGGTAILSRHEKGCYMDLLHAQFNNGHLSIDAIKNVLGNDFAKWGVLQKKFAQDADGLFYNVRLDVQIKKKLAYVSSRDENLLGHMGNGNGSGIDLDLKIKEFSEKVNVFINYTELMRNDFIEYWTECGEGQHKLRYEREKTFEIAKRLARWHRNNFKKLALNDNSKRTASTGLPGSAIVPGGRHPGNLREYRTNGTGG